MCLGKITRKYSNKEKHIEIKGYKMFHHLKDCEDLMVIRSPFFATIDLPQDKWLNANANVFDCNCGLEYQKGWHFLPTMKAAKTFASGLSKQIVCILPIKARRIIARGYQESMQPPFYKKEIPVIVAEQIFILSEELNRFKKEYNYLPEQY